MATKTITYLQAEGDANERFAARGAHNLLLEGEAQRQAGLLAPSRVVERRSVSSLTEEPEAESAAPPKVAATPSWLRTAALELGRADVTARQVLPPRSGAGSPSGRPRNSQTAELRPSPPRRQTRRLLR